MNTILQKRIEEVAKRYSWSHDTIGVDKETFHTEASQKHPIPIDKHVRVPIQHEMEVAFKCAAHFILNNQWISVEEGLPTYDEAVIGMDYMPELAWDDQTIIFVHRSNNPDVVTDKNKFCVYPPRFCKVTHWMMIPQLKGGEK